MTVADADVGGTDLLSSSMGAVSQVPTRSVSLRGGSLLSIPSRRAMPLARTFDLRA
jgi:hypothetical protein